MNPLMSPDIFCSFKRGDDICELLPSNSGPSTTTSPAPTEYPPTIECTFETDFCGFEVTGLPSFKFSRLQGEHMGNGEGPLEDAQGSR